MTAAESPAGTVRWGTEARLEQPRRPCLGQAHPGSDGPTATICQSEEPAWWPRGPGLPGSVTLHFPCLSDRPACGQHSCVRGHIPQPSLAPTSAPTLHSRAGPQNGPGPPLDPAGAPIPSRVQHRHLGQAEAGSREQARRHLICTLSASDRHLESESPCCWGGWSQHRAAVGARTYGEELP